VAQLQATLALAGVRIPEREAGVFGATTENGVRRMYRDAGYEPVLEPVEATADAPATTSLVLPQRELFALAVSPSTVVAYGVPLGERAEPGAVLITLSSGTPTITATLPAGVDPTASSVDLRAASDDGTWQASCRYAGPGGVPPVPDADTATTTPPAETAPGTPVVLTCDPAPDQAAVRQGVRVNAIVARSDGEVLAVPQSAVRALPDGTFEVEVARADGSRTVPVELGGEAGGMVEIRPAGGATVEAGDEVLATGSGP
jgi:hypothetical protein